MPEVVEAIAYVKFLNKEFGYSLTVPEFLAPDSIWDEHLLDWHLVYWNTFSDPALRKKARAHFDFFDRKGNFAPLYELMNEPEPEKREPDRVEVPTDEPTL